MLRPHPAALPAKADSIFPDSSVSFRFQLRRVPLLIYLLQGRRALCLHLVKSVRLLVPDSAMLLQIRLIGQFLIAPWPGDIP